MKNENHSGSFIQPVLLLILAVAVIAAAVFGICAAADGFLKDENGGWADEINQEPQSPVVLPETETQTEPVTETPAPAETESQTEAPTEPVTEPPTEPQTEAPAEDVEVYLVLKVGCNFRSGPSMDAEIYGTKEAGITVKFLEDVGGWYKVEIDGVVGYMGSQFF